MRLALALVIPLLAAESRQPPAGYWISERAEPRAWRDIRSAFHEELQPDDPAKRAPYVALRHKYIARVARFADVYLVIIGERIRAADKPDFDVFLAFSYDAQSRTKTAVRSAAFAKWEPVKWTAFAPKTPEVVFTHWSCIECEATYLLSSFFYDAGSRSWRLRGWPEDGEDIEVGSDWILGDEMNSRSECLYRIADFSRDGNADLAVWCREMFDPDSLKPVEKLTLYMVSADTPIRRAPDPIQARSLERVLCRNQKSHPLCSRVQTGR